MIRAFVLIALMLWPAVLHADELRPGYMELTEQTAGTWQLVWKQPVAAAPADRPSPPHLPANCAFAGVPDIGIAAQAIIGSAQVECSGTIGGETIAMPDMLGQSDMLVRIAPLDGPAQAMRLTASQPAALIAQQPGTLQVLQTYFALGVEHILAGWDHLLFVIALVLLVGRWKAAIAAATAFTVSHSITLAAASLGFVGLPGRPVEALIALSIVFLAVEVLRLRSGRETLTRRFPWVVAFLFGLLHGFGFAGALNSIGLPEGEVAPALLAFNIGVEAGQLLIVGAVLLILAAARRFAAAAYLPSIRLAAYAIGITGAYWLVERVAT
ncbi:HupE/UreJ family protein [Altererythrobacter luteolus]|uniref:HupE/UreJ family protein n=1 Tax=Pontixanthobacter luteolus TaxID=295089 RepID=A0A6I4V172_9SPHN|nr:HupE/UreJ family protein [Pontixanthobacter luteolus]MXP47588.1 HupE/UreJ family protein [Pontixanthobacter luteolus]